MSLISKLIGLMTVGGSVSSAYLMRRLVSKLITAVILAIVTGIMIAMLVAVGFYGLYFTMIHSGCDQIDAMITIAGLLVLITLILVAVTLTHVRNLRDGLRDALNSQVPFITDIKSVFEAFLEGFMAGPKG